MLSIVARRGITAVASKAVSPALQMRACVSQAERVVGCRFASTFRQFQNNTANSPLDDVLAIREKPDSLSYFTGNYKYNDLLIELEALHRKYADWKGPLSAGTPSTEDATLPSDLVQAASNEADEAGTNVYSWKLCDKMSELLGIPLKTSQWRKIVSQLNALASLPKPLPPQVEELLQPYRRTNIASERSLSSKKLDDLGRAYAVGRRKESSARCWVVEGEGKVLVNGVELENYFQRPIDRDEVTMPLDATENRERYNVWALVNGGGSTGQAQAVKLGIGRALLIHNPELKPALRQAGCVTRDPRVVERKKEGQRKARARYTWVKR